MSDDLTQEETIKRLRQELAAAPDKVTKRNAPIVWSVIETLIRERDAAREQVRAVLGEVTVEPDPPRCHCEEPKGESMDGRFCTACQDYEGTCINDHCDTCGAST